MENYIVMAIILTVGFGPAFAWNIYKIYRYSERVKDFVSKPFVCPNCGHRFYTKQKIIRPIGENKALLKCPNCRKRDVCGRPYDFDED